MDFVALLGLIALAGMDMRNTVILVDQIETDVRERGLSRREAIVFSTLASKGTDLPPKDETAPAPSRASVVLADAINDVHAIPFPASLRPTPASASGEVHRKPLELASAQ